MPDNYKQLIKTNILDEKTFVQASFKGQQKGQVVPWTQVKIRTVLIKNRQHHQFSYFDARQDITKNYTDHQVVEKLDQLLTFPFKNIHVETTAGNIHLQFTKKGKAIVHRSKVSDQQQKPDLSHNRRKDRLIPEDRSDLFLQAVGIMGKDGKIKAHMQGKFRQINQFLQLVEHTGALETFAKSPIHIVDFGCGNAYLTFAIYHYMTNLLNLPTHLVGVDKNMALLKKHDKKVQDLGWPNISFQAGRIIDFQPATLPDIVIALHACDTATDEALAQAITWQSKLIFCAPCCHHHLQQQLDQGPKPSSFQPVLRHGILKERQGDILTDAFRASILRIMGYQTDVIQFVSTEHTAKNLMIRAVKGEKSLPNEQMGQDYEALKAFWGVTPYLETLLGARFTRHLEV